MHAFVDGIGRRALGRMARGSGGARGGRDGTDVLSLARSGGRVEGQFDAREFSRLADVVLADREAPVAFSIAGTRDAFGRPALRLAVDGTAWMLCQRCLQPMRVAIEGETLIVVASNTREWEEWDQDESEVVLADRPVEAAELVEDEVILTLPFAPRHGEGECSAGAPGEV